MKTILLQEQVAAFHNRSISKRFVVVYCDATYIDAKYRVYCTGWDYESYVSVNGGEASYTNEFEGKLGEAFELSTSTIPGGECTVFIGWYMETVGFNGYEYILISDSQTFTYEITGEDGGLYAVWTTGENPFTKKYVDIRVVNGFVSYAGGEASENFDNAYSAISVSNSGRVRFFDDPTDETVYTVWDIAYRYELEGEVMHDLSESFDYYPAQYWVNDPQYDDTLEILAAEIQRLQEQGWNPPTILPIFGYNVYSRNNIYPFYEKFYKNPQYDSVWFKEDGKPVLCADLADTASPAYTDIFEDIKGHANLTDDQVNEFKEHFTFRNTLWPYQHNEKYDEVGADDMSWIDWYYPQHISGKGFINVSVAQHPAYAFSVSEHPEFRDIYYNRNCGRGWDYTTQTNSYRDVLSGLNLENQWKTALDNLDKVDEVMVTGWNEWTAAKLTTYHDAYQGYVQFADQFNMEFSRDLEMMADEDGYGDNFYLQNMRNTRAFKQTKKVAFVGGKASPALDNAAEWDKGRTYLDISGEVVERNHRNTDGSGMYVNTTNRNDVVSTQMVNDGEYLYIRITTLDDIVIEQGAQNNLNILLSIGGSNAPAWEGYQFILNRSAAKAGLSKTSLEQVKEVGRYEFNSVCEVDSYLNGKTFAVKIPLSKLGIKNTKNFTVDFKVADGISDPSNIMKYYIDGESAPVGRLNYRYNAGK